jgi:hypothetical protein
MRKGGKAEKWAARNERLSAALRANLKRRKAQARGRAAGEPSGRGETPDAENGKPDDPDFRRNQGTD